MSVRVDASDVKRWNDLLTSIISGSGIADEDYEHIEGLWDLVEALLLASPKGSLEVAIRADRKRSMSWRVGTIDRALKKRLGTPGDFPQSTKLKSVQGQSKILMEFLGNLHNLGYAITLQKDGIKEANPVHVLAAHLGINEDALQEEREDALQRVRAAPEFTADKQTETIH